MGAASIDTNEYQYMLAAVASVLQLEVTLVDDQLVRIAGTGPYRNRIGERLHPDSAFGQALGTGRSVTVEHPRRAPICQACAVRAACQETAHVATPILGEERPVGVLGLVAFTSPQRTRLLQSLERYADFLGRISGLIAARMKAERTRRKLAQTEGFLHAMANAVDEGLIGVDRTGAVTFISGPARRLLGLPEEAALASVSELDGLDRLVWAVLQGREAVADREVSVTVHGRTARLMGSVRPIRVEEQVAGAVVSLRDLNAVHQLAYRLTEELPAHGFERIIYRSEAMRSVVSQARRVARSPATVLIRGESGTGKELLARALHAASPRRDGPFVAINCAAIPEELLESELFGYADGAFTGASRGGKPGKFELAHRGSIFLDEIGDMSLRLQAKLLRVLQESEVERVGGTRPIRLDVRVIAATNRDLEAMIARREFREDLYYRLNVIPLEIPPLRERPEDIPLLLEYFIRQLGGPGADFTPAARELLVRYRWPGNVRELENAVAYASQMAPGPVIDVDALPVRVREAAGEPDGAGESGDTTAASGEHSMDAGSRGGGLIPLEQLERQQIERGLQLYGRSDSAIRRIARELGLSRATLYRRLRKYGLQEPSESVST